MSCRLEHTHVGSWSAIVLQNDAMCVTVVPEIGGKILSLRSLRTGREWLWTNPYLPFRKPPPGSTNFGAFDAGGWDELFPTVNACQIPNSAWGDRKITDHGELWFRQWKTLVTGVDSQSIATLTTAVDDRDLPFRFERTLTLPDGLAPLAARYSLTNRSTLPMPMIWAAHPLLAIEPGDSFCLPEGTRVSYTGTIGLELPPNLTEFAWPNLPLATGGSLDLSRAPQPSARVAIKLFVENVQGNAIGIVSRDQTEVLRLHLEQTHATHIGLWLNYNAWSGANTPPYYNAGIEPTNFPHDDLRIATEMRSSELAPGAFCDWELSVSFDESTTRLPS
ncbi:MAG: DUF5107 domain-containing protein [Pirellulales bacterium]|nr:DUF5107 domain-containing protein [Pirellulales bacterium]